MCFYVNHTMSQKRDVVPIGSAHWCLLTSSKRERWRLPACPRSTRPWCEPWQTWHLLWMPPTSWKSLFGWQPHDCQWPSEDPPLESFPFQTSSRCLSACSGEARLHRARRRGHPSEQLAPCSKRLLWQQDGRNPRHVNCHKIFNPSQTKKNETWETFYSTILRYLL